MKAIQIQKFGGPEVLSLVEVAAPKSAPDEILIDVKAAGVNPVDLAFCSGKHPRAKNLALPWTPGWDAAGIVFAVGKNVHDFQVGHVVCGIAKKGSYAEQAILDINQTILLPSGVSFSQGASLPFVAYTAYEAIANKARIQAG